MTKFTRWLFVALATQSFTINVTKVARNASDNVGSFESGPSK